MPCSYCAVVNKICIWGLRPEKAWKRVSFFIASLVLGAGFGWCMWLLRGHEHYLLFASLAVLYGAATLAVDADLFLTLQT